MRRRLLGCAHLLLWTNVILDSIPIGSSAPDAKYLGCFKDDGNPRAFKGYVDHFGNLTPQKCVELCYNQGFRYSATQDRSYCFCGDKPPHPTSKASEDRCSKRCSGNPAEKCGGEDSVSVTKTGIPDYSEEDKYLGCFQDIHQTFNDVLLTYQKTNSPRRCMNICLQLNYKFAGVRNSKECICGNVELGAEFLRGDDECRWPCSGDASDFCGGNLRVALYSTGSSESTGSTVSTGLTITTASTGSTDSRGCTDVLNGFVPQRFAEDAWPPPGKKKYFVETQIQIDWHESLMACLRNKTRLATVDNVEELEELRATIKRTGVKMGSFYVSASDVGKEGDYVWVTSGKLLSGAKGPMWPDFENNHNPDNWQNNEHCIAITERSEGQGYYFNDVPCASKTSYVCEYYVPQ